MQLSRKSKANELPIRRTLGITLVQTFNWVYDQAQEFFAAYGITAQQYNVLKIIHDAKEPLSTAQILDQMIEKNAGVSRLVDRLVLKGLITKQAKLTDKRQIDASLTKEGLKVYQEVTRNLETADNVYASLTDKEVIALTRLLNKIKDKE